jgi:hypothetical protein
MVKKNDTQTERKAQIYDRQIDRPLRKKAEKRMGDEILFVLFG